MGWETVCLLELSWNSTFCFRIYKFLFTTKSTEDTEEVRSEI